MTVVTSFFWQLWLVESVLTRNDGHAQPTVAPNLHPGPTSSHTTPPKRTIHLLEAEPSIRSQPSPTASDAGPSRRQGHGLLQTPRPNRPRQPQGLQRPNHQHTHHRARAPPTTEPQRAGGEEGAGAPRWVGRRGRRWGADPDRPRPPCSSSLSPGSAPSSPQVCALDLPVDRRIWGARREGGYREI